jgi:hypothetical protein
MFGSTCGPCLFLEWFMSYEKFPMWTHKQGEKSRIVHSQEELEALGAGWSDANHVPPKVYVDSAVFLEYPKMVNGVIVHSAEEEAALAPTLEQMCDAIASAPVEPESDERTALMQIADERGVKIDRRWSAEKIRAAVEAA